MTEGGPAPIYGRVLPAPGDLIADRYRVERVLGRGGMGVAYAATNVVTGKQLALKWILRDPNASRLQRVIREARAAGRIRHPNIVDVYDVGEHDGSLFLVMELLTGQSLQELLDARGPLQPDQVLHWLLPALLGVRAAHRSGVIHRDLKPGNIFLCRDEAGEPLTAKVLDFGVSKITATDGGVDDPSMTDSSAVVGTPSYTAPEQLERAHSATERSDVYACGAILYHMLSGKRPFEADNYARLVVKIMTSAPVPLRELRPELPWELCDVVERAMRRKPEQRFPDMDALIHALESVPLSQETQAPRARRASGAIGLRTRQRLALVGLILLILIGLRVGWADTAAPEASPRRSVAAVVTPSAPAAPEAALGPEAAPLAASAESSVLDPPSASQQSAGDDRRGRSSERRSGKARGPRGSQQAAGEVAKPAAPEAIVELGADDF